MPKPTPEQVAAATAPPESHRGSLITIVVLIILLLVAIVASVMLYLQNVENADDASYFTDRAMLCEDNLDECNEELAVMEEVEDEEVVYGGGMVETDELSFEYPEGVLVQLTRPLGGSEINRTYEFLFLSDSDLLTRVGYELGYFRTLESGVDGGATFDEVLEHWTVDYADITITGEIDGKRFLRVETGDLSGDTVTYYIESNDPTMVSKINGHFLQQPYADDVINMLFETLTFNETDEESVEEGDSTDAE